MYKYLIEKEKDSNKSIIDRVYFDTVEGLFDYLNKYKDTIFNCGFTSYNIHLYRIQKGE